MKRTFLALILAASAGCDSNIESSSEATPSPSEATRSSSQGTQPAAAATPKPGDWRLKDYKNPLDQKPKSRH